MKNTPLNPVEIRDRIDEHIEHIETWTTVLAALEQKTPEVLEIPNRTMGGIARSIQKSISQIKEMVNVLAENHE